jgi:Tetracyclin repressor-like, C-terminal domain
MSDFDSKFSVQDLLNEPTRWDELIAADLSVEIRAMLAEKVDTIPEMRRFLAIKGYQELHQRLQAAVEGKAGEEALRALAFAMRAYAHDRPGLSAATFRNLIVDSPEWRREGESLGRFVLGVLAGVGLTGHPAILALRILRALVRGFVLHEMALSLPGTARLRRDVRHRGRSLYSRIECIAGGCNLMRRRLKKCHAPIV